MFDKGELVVCGNNGVCRIQKIAPMEGMDKNTLYYIMQPVYEKRSTVYIPAESHKTPVRKIHTAQEAQEIIRKLPDIEPLVIENERNREAEYKACMAPAECECWISLMKTLYKRNQERIAAGKKMISLDDRYMKSAQNCLCGELSISLKISREEVEKHIDQLLEAWYSACQSSQI